MPGARYLEGHRGDPKGPWAYFGSHGKVALELGGGPYYDVKCRSQIPILCCRRSVIGQGLIRSILLGIDWDHRIRTFIRAAWIYGKSYFHTGLGINAAEKHISVEEHGLGPGRASPG